MLRIGTSSKRFGRCNTDNHDSRRTSWNFNRHFSRTKMSLMILLMCWTHWCVCIMVQSVHVAGCARLCFTKTESFAFTKNLIPCHKTIIGSTCPLTCHSRVDCTPSRVSRFGAGTKCSEWALLLQIFSDHSRVDNISGIFEIIQDTCPCTVR